MPEFQFTRPQGARLQITTHPLEKSLFQFTRPQGARRVEHLALMAPGDVSIHAPARGATRTTAAPGTPGGWFQFTRPQGARHAAAMREALVMVFQFTRPQGARPLTLRRRRVKQRFNSRARKGRDEDGRQDGYEVRVSIHAPARGATGVTMNAQSVSMFQFTRPQGARRVTGLEAQIEMGVSIHAPARGAT